LNDLRLCLASPVYLVMADAVLNPYVKQSIKASKQQIYAACPWAYLSVILEGMATRG
jgi:hypothetical protein